MKELNTTGKYTLDAETKAKIDENFYGYSCDEEGTALNFEVLSKAIGCVRSACAPLSADWKAEIEADFERRK